MSSKNSKKYKKYKLKLEYFFLEYNDILEQQKIYEKQFNEEFKNELQQCFSSLNNENINNNEEINDNNEEINDDNEEINNNENLNNKKKIPKSNIITKLFRKLSKLYHPDHNLNNTENDKIYNNIKKAYDDNDLIELIMYAMQNNIEFGELDDNLINQIDKKIDELNEKINTLKKTAAWLWYTTDDIEKKNKLKNFFYKQWNPN